MNMVYPNGTICSSDAEEIVSRVAVKLSNPIQVEQQSKSAHNLDRIPGMDPCHPWQSLSLADGFPGVSILHSELAGVENKNRTWSHDCLAASIRYVSKSRSSRMAGLFNGPASLAYAAQVASQSESDYEGLRAQLGEIVVSQLQENLKREESRLSTGPRIAHTNAFDVISGLAGIGRLLIMQGGQYTEEIRSVLNYMVALSEPTIIQGRQVPGWIVKDSAGILKNDAGGGTFDLGMAHGISGPLALLAIAELNGFSTSGAPEALNRMADWLLLWQQRDAAGIFWPASITEQEQISGALMNEPSPNHSWCWGSPGIARALYLAGAASGNSRYMKCAMDAFRATLVRVESNANLVDPGLCHGWGGLLRIAQAMVEDTGDAVIADRLGSLAYRVAKSFDVESPFGFYFLTSSYLARDRAGFLGGAAGAALALQGFSGGSPSRTKWDSALLIS